MVVENAAAPSDLERIQAHAQWLEEQVAALRPTATAEAVHTDNTLQGEELQAKLWEAATLARMADLTAELKQAIAKRAADIDKGLTSTPDYERACRRLAKNFPGLAVDVLPRVHERELQAIGAAAIANWERWREARGLSVGAKRMKPDQHVPYEEMPFDVAKELEAIKAGLPDELVATP